MTITYKYKIAIGGISTECSTYSPLLQNKENLVLCSWLILIAILCDFLDGKLARFLKATSDYGKQLDSFADMVSFGIAPAVIVFQLINIHNTQLAYIACLIPIFSALRLANYNIDKKQTIHFIGVTTPINALFFCSFPLILNYEKNNTHTYNYTILEKRD